MVSVTEGHEVECGTSRTNFDARIFATVSQSLDVLTEDERKLIQATFLETYNSLSFGNCDNQFRRIDSVDLDPNESGTIVYRKLLDAEELNGSNETFWYASNTTSNATLHNVTTTTMGSSPEEPTAEEPNAEDSDGSQAVSTVAFFCHGDLSQLCCRRGRQLFFIQ